MANNAMNGGNNPAADLKDSKKDLAEIKPEYATIDLPDVKDIPGQENIVPLPMGELADDTISSVDEEGNDLFDDDDEEPEDDSDADVSESEKEDLEETETNLPTEDDAVLHEAELDDTDEDGDPLNEAGSGVSGSDLDVPGAEDDDEDEETGNEDEENNEYSLGGDDHDDISGDEF